MARGFALFLLAFGVLLTAVGTMGVMIFAFAPGGGAVVLPVFAVVGAVGVVLLVWAIRVLRRTKPIGEWSKVVDGRVGAYLADADETHELDGSPYTVHFQTPVPGKNGRPSSLTVSTPAACPGEFRITGESWFDRVCKNFGLAVEHQTGEPEFDALCYVRTDTVAFAEAYLKDPIKRVAIVDLRRLGFPEVSLKDGRVSVRWVGFDPNSHASPDLPADAAARLLLLARNLPPHQPEFDERVGANRKRWGVVLWVLLVAFALTILSLLAYVPIRSGELLARAALVFLPVAPAFAYLAALLLRGTSTSHYVWGVLMLGAVFLLPVGCVGTVCLLNGTLDGSPAVAHDAVIVEKYTTRSKNQTSYHVRVASWREPGETESFKIGSADFGAVVPHQSRLVVTTRAGGLGLEWLVSKWVEVRPGKP